MADTKTAEKTVPVLLKNDVWIEDSNGEVVRIRTNIPRLDQDGNLLVDRKSKTVVSDQIVTHLPVSIAKKLIAEGKAERADPLPE